MADDKPDEDPTDHDNAEPGAQESSGRTSPKVVPIRPPRKPLGDERLEEIRRLLGESVPMPEPDPEDDLSDENVVRYRQAFRRRFGIGFDWLPHHRKALIALIHEYGLTDREVKMFRHTGNLKRTPLSVELTANRWIALWGGLQLVVFGTLFGALCVAVVPNLSSDPVRALRAILTLGGLFALCYAIYWLYIKPWIVQARVESS